MVEKATSWGHLLQLLYADEYREKNLYNMIGRYRSFYLYRGLNRDWPLQTTLMRIGGDYSLRESHLLRNFYKFGRSMNVPSNSFWEWLSLAQHYGLPTRLLDWTASPLVAIHFATANIDHYDKSGYIWAVHRPSVHKHLPKNFSKSLEDEDVVNFTAEMLSSLLGFPKTSDFFNARKCLKKFDRFKPSNSADQFVLFFEPPSIDERIVNQFAAFSIMNSPNGRIDHWLLKHGNNYYRKIEIPPTLKLEIRDRLDMSNITERVVFPGLDGLSAWLKRHYSDLKTRRMK